MVYNVDILMNGYLFGNVLLGVVSWFHPVRLSVGVGVVQFLTGKCDFVGDFFKILDVGIIVWNTYLELASILKIWNIIFLITMIMALIVQLGSHV